MAEGHAVAVLVVTPQGVPLVRDPKKEAPIYWKLPGGRSKPNETARGCAVREIEEELGISLSGLDLSVVHSKDKGTHTLTIFRVDLTVLTQMRSEGDEGEEIGVFKPSEILAMQYFFPNHRKVVGQILANLN